MQDKPGPPQRDNTSAVPCPLCQTQHWGGPEPPPALQIQEPQGPMALTEATKRPGCLLMGRGPTVGTVPKHPGQGQGGRDDLEPPPRPAGTRAADGETEAQGAQAASRFAGSPDVLGMGTSRHRNKDQELQGLTEGTQGS